MSEGEGKKTRPWREAEEGGREEMREGGEGRDGRREREGKGIQRGGGREGN